MKNLKKISRSKLSSVKGGVEANCHCSPSGSGKPPRDFIADNATHCFQLCDAYRAS